ncbi:MAG: hypothetical protein PHE09_17045 [Oscillospiraceae bacterium]|nr:hypothetical protein [Oscillospiraceae bacterium]
MKKRNCRMTEEEKAMHDRAVKIKKMTDAQICEFIDRTYGKGMEEGAKLAQIQQTPAPEDTANQAEKFIKYLEGRTGSGNRIGLGTILQLKRELENATSSGMFSEEATS